MAENQVEENIDDLAKTMGDYVGSAGGPSEISEETLANVAGGVDRQDIYRGCELVYKAVKSVVSDTLMDKIGPRMDPVIGTGGLR